MITRTYCSSMVEANPGAGGEFVWQRQRARLCKHALKPLVMGSGFGVFVI